MTNPIAARLAEALRTARDYVSESGTYATTPALRNAADCDLQKINLVLSDFAASEARGREEAAKLSGMWDAAALGSAAPSPTADLRGLEKSVPWSRLSHVLSEYLNHDASNGSEEWEDHGRELRHWLPDIQTAIEAAIRGGTGEAPTDTERAIARLRAARDPDFMSETEALQASEIASLRQQLHKTEQEMKERGTDIDTLKTALEVM